MKWLSKIFKGSGGGGGSSRGSSIGGRHPQFLEDENMVWRVPSRSLVIYVYYFFLYTFVYLEFL